MRRYQMPETLTARTPGATRAAPGEYFFDLAKLDKVHGGPDYTTAIGPCVEGDRMIVALMRMPAGTGAEPHSHPNEQWIFVVEGVLSASIDNKTIEARSGTVLYIPANAVHSVKAMPQAEGVFFTVKDASHGLQGTKAT
jgi:quercetin dioxygenase-like cupin family protein